MNDPFFKLRSVVVSRTIGSEKWPDETWWQIFYVDGTEEVDIGTDFCQHGDAIEACQELNWAYELGYKNCQEDNDIRPDC